MIHRLATKTHKKIYALSTLEAICKALVCQSGDLLVNE
ncbi:helix-turn-helix domain-containing protein [Xanthomarina sp. F2636L]